MGGDYPHRTYALLRGRGRVLTRRAHARPAWGNLLRRDSPRPPSDLFTPPKHPFWRKFLGTFPSAEAGGGFRQMGKPWPLAGCWEKAQQSTRGPGDGNGFPWGWQVPIPLVCIRVSRRRVAWGKFSSWLQRHPARVAAGPCPPRVAAGPCPPRVGAGPCPPHLVENFVETVERTKNARLFLNKPGIFLTLVTGWKEKKDEKGKKRDYWIRSLGSAMANPCSSRPSITWPRIWLLVWETAWIR